MMILSGADLVLADRVLSPGTLSVDGSRIADVEPGARPSRGDTTWVDLSGHYVVPGFIDVHVHGVEGHDTLDGPQAIAALAGRLPRYGVTAFCPTTVACSPQALRDVLRAVGQARAARAARASYVLAAHLESNFINPDFRGAQPLACLRRPPAADPELGAGGWGLGTGAPTGRRAPGTRHAAHGTGSGDFSAEDILEEIATAAEDVGIVTLAPELEGALELVRRLVAGGHRVSLGHSAATFEQGLAGIQAGARQATHLFNRMPPLGHRDPGLAGAILQSDEVAAEIICDGYHVHPAVLRVAIAAKHPSRVMAITDGTAGSGLPVGSRTALGGRAITVRESAAYLDDGTLAGSVCAMDRAFRVLVEDVGLSLVDAATLCATTPAREVGLHGPRILAAGAPADLVVLDRKFRVRRTYIGGELAFQRTD